MSLAQIEVLVSPTGETSIKTVGFNGPQCREATRELEAALGIKLTETLTAEYHLNATQEMSNAERANASR